MICIKAGAHTPPVVALCGTGLARRGDPFYRSSKALSYTFGTFLDKPYRRKLLLNNVMRPGGPLQVNAFEICLLR